MEPEQLVRRFYADYRGRNLDDAMAVCHEDVTFSWISRHGLQFAETVCGKQCFLDRFAAVEQVFEYLAFDVDDLIASGNRVATQVSITLRHHATGREFTIRAADFWTFENGRATAFVEYLDTAYANSILAGD